MTPGGFPAPWLEWNGRFRDDMRRWLRGERVERERAALRLAGSPDLYANPTLATNRSINFITCHDGFTLNDLVSYNQKHNEANYVYINFSGPPTTPEKFRFEMRHREGLMRMAFVCKPVPKPPVEAEAAPVPGPAPEAPNG